MTSIIVLNSAIGRYLVLQYSIRMNDVKEWSTLVIVLQGNSVWGKFRNYFFKTLDNQITGRKWQTWQWRLPVSGKVPKNV